MLEQYLEDSWRSRLADEFKQPYFQILWSRLQEDQKEGITVFPEEKLIFNALNCCPFERLKVVILGQDPYHGDGQAHGLAFSVPEGIPLPPSLRNIFKELETDLGISPSKSGNLERWARQGVLLLNATLTVRAHEVASHQQLGWEQFTNQIIRSIATENSGMVFLLWGKAAHKKAALINQGKHLVLKAAHPSPLSAYNGFFGCRHFSQTNAYLAGLGKEAIQW